MRLQLRRMRTSVLPTPLTRAPAPLPLFPGTFPRCPLARQLELDLSEKSSLRSMARPSFLARCSLTPLISSSSFRERRHPRGSRVALPYVPPESNTLYSRLIAPLPPLAAVVFTGGISPSDLPLPPCPALSLTLPPSSFFRPALVAPYLRLRVLLPTHLHNRHLVLSRSPLGREVSHLRTLRRWHGRGSLDVQQLVHRRKQCVSLPSPPSSSPEHV